MYGRYQGSQQPTTMGQPMQFNSNLDYDDGYYLETIPEVESVYTRSRPQSTAAALPELPFRVVPKLNDNDPIYRQSVSSVYSQPSPTQTTHEHHEITTKSPDAPPDVSPMSTPRSSANFAASDTSLVSPIESSFNIPRRSPKLEQPPKSNIPRPTNVLRPVQQPPPGRKPGEETKWDDYSGEPTTEDSGKAAQVRPGTQQPLEMQYPQLKERTKQILAGLRDRGAAPPKTTWGRAPPPVAADPLDHPPVQKEPWKGASGREAIVAPVKNTASARVGPLKHPQRNVSKMDPALDQARTASPDMRQSPTLSESPDLVSPQVSQRTYPTQPKVKPVPRPDLSIRVIPSQEEIKPVAPLKVKSAVVRSPDEAENLASLQSPFHSPHPSQANANSDLSAAMKYGRQTESDRVQTGSPQLPRNAVGNPGHIRPNETIQNLGASHLPHEPVSHLSWTTYAITANDSPDSLGPTHFDDNPVPPLSSISSPLVMRKRPVPTATSSLPFSNLDASGSRVSIISRKPVPGERGRTASIMSSASKSLPPTPTEMQAGDKLETLRARLDDLSMRRRNNTKIIREMEDDLKRNTIAYDTRKRMNVEKQITNMEQELMDIGREEHDVGLQLHRAQKKRDRENCYENPTGLWIKRVTN